MATAYEQLIAELQQLQNAPAPRPMFTPEQQAARIRANNDQAGLGLLGSMSGDVGVKNTGGTVFKNALGDRDEKISAQGILDPLSGILAESPEYQQQKQDTRKGKVLEQAMRFEDQRQRAQERADQARQRARDQMEMKRLVASGRASNDPELLDLKKRLIESQINGNMSRVDQAEDKIQGKKDKAKAAAASAVGKAQNILDQVGTALGQSKSLTTGAAGKVFSNIPGTKAYDLKSTVATIKANIGFEELNAMRQASPTGGALGQVAVRELDYLQAVLGNLDQAQSKKQFVENLGLVKKHFTNWKNVMQQAASGEGGASGGYGDSPPPARSQPGGGTVPAPPGVDPGTWQHMTPEERKLWN